MFSELNSKLSGNNDIYGGSTVINNCNNAECGSIYYVYASAINAPFSGNESILLTFGRSENLKIQMAYSYTEVRVRRCYNGTWSSWLSI